jgi:hypothetical protein
MIAFYSRRFSTCLTALLCLLGASCESVSHPAQVPVPLSAVVEGHWRCDSGWFAIYNSRQKLLNKSIDSTGSAPSLTIDAVSWHYLDRIPSEYTYTRSGDTLLVSRRGDQHLVDLHYIRPEEIGKVIGKPTRLQILSLTLHQLTVQDSTIDPDGSLIRVGRIYYSR